MNPAALQTKHLRDVLEPNAISILADASGYYRELLAEAEYPLATKRWFRIESLSEDEVRAIYEKDWRQYSDWLTRA